MFNHWRNTNDQRYDQFKSIQINSNHLNIVIPINQSINQSIIDSFDSSMKPIKLGDNAHFMKSSYRLIIVEPINQSLIR